MRFRSVLSSPIPVEILKKDLPYGELFFDNVTTRGALLRGLERRFLWAEKHLLLLNYWL